MNIKLTVFESKWITILAFILSINIGYAQSQKEILFSSDEASSTLRLAKEQEKPVFINVSASWCGPCKKLKKQTFTDPQVAEYFNEKFISISLDGEKGDGIEMRKKYGLKAYPSLIFLDKNGQTKLVTYGFQSPQKLIALAEKSLN